MKTIEESERRITGALSGLTGSTLTGRAAAGQTTDTSTKPDFYALSESGRPVVRLVLEAGADHIDPEIVAARNGWRVVAADEFNRPYEEARERIRASLADVTAGDDDAIGAAVGQPDDRRLDRLSGLTVKRQPDEDRFGKELAETKRTVEEIGAKLDQMPTSRPARESTAPKRFPLPNRKNRSGSAGILTEIRG